MSYKWFMLFLCFISLSSSCGGNDGSDENGPEVEKGLPVFYITGSRTDKVTAHREGLVLVGGGTDVDPAMKWMLQQANGGDVVVIRSSGEDGYNDYFFSKLGIWVNSVTSIVIDSREKAQKDSVFRTICRAEVLFIAGGDQGKYVDYWQGTKVEDALKYLVETKKATVGGTSAGMAVWAQYCYPGKPESATSAEALNNPYHPNVSLVDDFLNHPLMLATVTDTHFSQRTRMGRFVTFMARMSKDWNIVPRGIACDEKTAVCVTPDGKASVYGAGKAFFTCQGTTIPEVCENGKPLTWHGVKCYEITADVAGTNGFDLISWNSGNGGVWKEINVDAGILRME